MKHIINGIEETLAEYEVRQYRVAAGREPGLRKTYREKTAKEIFEYVLSELEINTEALRDSERRSISKEPYK